MNEIVKERSTISANYRNVACKQCSMGSESETVDSSVADELKAEELSGSSERIFMYSSKKSFSFINLVLFESRADLLLKSVLPSTDL